MPINKTKTPPKNPVKFTLTLSEEQKLAKTEILNHGLACPSVICF